MSAAGIVAAARCTAFKSLPSSSEAFVCCCFTYSLLLIGSPSGSPFKSKLSLGFVYPVRLNPQLFFTQ